MLQNVRKREGYVSQKELFLTSFAVRVTNNFAILVGSFFHPFLGQSKATNFIISIKFATKTGNNFYTYAGGELLWLPEFDVIAISYSGLSVDEPNL